MRIRALCLLFSALVAGCYQSHGATGGPDGAVACGTEVCASDEQCCIGCGVTGCVPAGEMCPFCPIMPCTSNADCATGSYCQSPLGACGAPGACSRIDESCSTERFPVCGCDGNTYTNACLAAQAGVSLVANVPCGPPCGRGGRPCAPDELCDLGPRCGADDAVGCRMRPTECPPGGEPVCGCDGATYTNACVAASAGVTVTTPDRCGLVDPSAACMPLCDVLVACGAPMDCIPTCVAQLSDCSADELGRVLSCAVEGDCMATIACIQEIPCVL